MYIYILVPMMHYFPACLHYVSFIIGLCFMVMVTPPSKNKLLWAQWAYMAPAWLHMAPCGPIRTIWHQRPPYGTRWPHIAPNDSRCPHMVYLASHETVWHHRVPYAPCGAMWHVGRPYGDIGVSYGGTWSYMVPDGPTWPHMGTHAPMCLNMGTYGPMWHHMGPCGTMCAHGVDI